MDYSREPHGVYFLIDNKSFYCSVEAVARGRNPLKTLMVVMSEAENTNGGLVLATSPMAKKTFGLKANVSRRRDLPDDPHLIVVPPRMNLYIEKNLAINNIFKQFVADEDLLPYSIDESILDLTHSWQLFGKTPQAVAKLIQQTVKTQLGLYTTIGIGQNPVQAKIALDIYAKHSDDLIGETNYQNIPQTIWTIPDLTSVWGIGKRTAAHLKRLGIHNMYDLAHCDPFFLKKELGIMGWQLYATAWGIDRSNLHQRIKPKERSIGNSQVLPRDYRIQAEIETVIKEMGEQVAARLRSHHVQATSLSLGIGFSYADTVDDGRNGFHLSHKIEPTNANHNLVRELINIFRDNWQGQSIRNIAVYTGKLAPENGQQLNLFQEPHQQIKSYQVNRTVDNIRRQFGFQKLVYARSLTKGGTAITRASLVGGHNGGNAYE